MKIKRVKFILVFLLMVYSFSGNSGFGQEAKRCYIDKILSFACESQWQVQTMGEMMVLKNEQWPHLAISVVEVPTTFSVLEELSWPFFQAQEIYAENFQRERIVIDNTPAIKVNDYAKNNPQMRQVGVTFLKDEKLVSLLFSVYPEIYWNDYQFEIKNIIDSLRFENDSEK